jgi:hypothetical protein
MTLYGLGVLTDVMQMLKERRPWPDVRCIEFEAAPPATFREAARMLLPRASDFAIGRPSRATPTAHHTTRIIAGAAMNRTA